MARSKVLVKKKGRTISAKSRRPSKSHAQRRPSNTRAQIKSTASDVEGVLVDMILSSNVIAENGTSIENLIYNATPKVAEIGYSYGFSIGRELCLKQQETQKFTSILDRIGLSDALYYPLKDSLIITSKPPSNKPQNIGRAIHVYEAGLISGYLSMSTGIKINTTEKRCIYNGSDTCQFVSLPMSSMHTPQRMELEGIINTIAHSISDSDFKKLHKEYYRVMAYLPLLKQPMYEQVRKLMIMSGERIGEYTNKNDTRRIIKNITNYFGVKDAQIFLRRQGKSIIKLRFESYNSIYPYVSLPTAMIVGFISSAFGASAEVSTSTNKDKTYTTIIGFK